MYGKSKVMPHPKNIVHQIGRSVVFHCVQVAADRHTPGSFKAGSVKIQFFEQQRFVEIVWCSRRIQNKTVTIGREEKRRKGTEEVKKDEKDDRISSIKRIRYRSRRCASHRSRDKVVARTSYQRISVHRWPLPPLIWNLTSSLEWNRKIKMRRWSAIRVRYKIENWQD